MATVNGVGGDERVRFCSGEGLEAEGESRERGVRQRGLRLGALDSWGCGELSGKLGRVLARL